MRGVLAAVGAAAGIEFMAEGYPSNVAGWVAAKSNGLQPVYQYPTKGFGTRALGFGVVAVALNFFDAGDLAPVAEAMAGVFLVAVVLLRGPQAFANLGATFGIDTASSIAGDVPLKPTPTATAAPAKTSYSGSGGVLV